MLKKLRRTVCEANCLLPEYNTVSYLLDNMLSSVSLS